MNDNWINTPPQARPAKWRCQCECDVESVTELNRWKEKKRMVKNIWNVTKKQTQKLKTKKKIQKKINECWWHWWWKCTVKMFVFWLSSWWWQPFHFLQLNWKGIMDTGFQESRVDLFGFKIPQSVDGFITAPAHKNNPYEYTVKKSW